MHFCGVVFLMECGIIFPLHFRSMIWSRQESHMDINDLKWFACAAGLGNITCAAAGALLHRHALLLAGWPDCGTACDCLP